MKIGIIGYGQMGSGAAYNLNKKHDLFIYDGHVKTIFYK